MHLLLLPEGKKMIEPDSLKKKLKYLLKINFFRLQEHYSSWLISMLTILTILDYFNKLMAFPWPLISFKKANLQ